MSSTKEIVELESRQTSVSRLDIHLHREGTFLRAYEWSAFLSCERGTLFTQELKKESPLQPPPKEEAFDLPFRIHPQLHLLESGMIFVSK